MTRRGEERRADEVGRSVFVVLSVRFTIKTFGEIKISGTMHPRPHTHTHTHTQSMHTQQTIQLRERSYDTMQRWPGKRSRVGRKQDTIEKKIRVNMRVNSSAFRHRGLPTSPNSRNKRRRFNNNNNNSSPSIS